MILADVANVCILCGRTKPKRNKYYCSKACEANHRQHYRVCLVCGNTFKTSPTNDNVCCSAKCSSVHRQRMHENGVYENNMRRLREGNERFLGEYSGEKHVNAKFWELQSPSGQVYTCRNLMHFIKTHPTLFDGTPKQAFDGFAKIKATKQGKRPKSPSNSWKGWRLISWGD